MIKIAFFNNKGGVGKSSAVINIAHAMSLSGKTVVVSDNDTQHNSWRFFLEPSRYGDTHLVQTYTRYDGIHIHLNDSNRTKYHFGLEETFDYELIDMPPTLNESTKTFLAICDFVFVPIELGTFAIQGTANVTEAIAQTGARFGGCFVSKFDRKNPADHELDELLRQTFSSKAMTERIPYSRVIKNSIIYRQTAFEYMGWTSAAQAYMSLTKEILAICGETKNQYAEGGNDNG